MLPRPHVVGRNGVEGLGEDGCVDSCYGVPVIFESLTERILDELIGLAAPIVRIRCMIERHEISIGLGAVLSWEKTEMFSEQLTT